MNNKERLKDIKNARYFFHDVQDSDLLKDWNWLIEQAEEVQELQEENKRYREALEHIERIQSVDVAQQIIRQVLEESK